MASSYSMQDIQSALDNQLISPQDAEFLAKSLESQPSGLGAAAGALGAGALLGAGGGKLAASALKNTGDGFMGKMGQSLREGGAGASVAEGLGEYGARAPAMLGNRSQAALGGAAIGGGLGTGLGAIGGAYGAAGEGMDEETSQAFQMLIDPNTDKKTKQQIMMYLEQKAQEMQQGGQQPQQEEGGMGLGQMAAMTGGGLIGGAAMGQAGKWASRALGDGISPIARGAQAMDTRRMLPEGMQNRMFDSIHPGEAVGSALGLGSGAAAGNQLMNQYEDPLM